MKQTILLKVAYATNCLGMKASFFVPTQRDLTVHSSFFPYLRTKSEIKNSRLQTLSRSSRGFSFSALLALSLSLSLFPPVLPPSLSLSPFFFSIFHALFCRNLTSTRRPQCRKRKYLYQRVAAFAPYCIISDTRADHINSTN